MTRGSATPGEQAELGKLRKSSVRWGGKQLLPTLAVDEGAECQTLLLPRAFSARQIVLTAEQEKEQRRGEAQQTITQRHKQAAIWMPRVKGNVDSRRL